LSSELFGIMNNILFKWFVCIKVVEYKPKSTPRNHFSHVRLHPFIYIYTSKPLQSCEIASIYIPRNHFSHVRLHPFIYINGCNLTWLK